MPASPLPRHRPASPSRRGFLRDGCLVLGAAALPAGFGAAAADGRRIALLICCGSYPDGKNIQPARKNGRDLEAALRRQGFEVSVENDLDLPRFKAAVARFGERMAALPNDGQTIGLIYFCGHGM